MYNPDDPNKVVVYRGLISVIVRRPLHIRNETFDITMENVYETIADTVDVRDVIKTALLDGPLKGFEVEVDIR